MTPAERLETQSALLLAQYRALLRELRESADRAELTLPRAEFWRMWNVMAGYRTGLLADS